MWSWQSPKLSFDEIPTLSNGIAIFNDPLLATLKLIKTFAIKQHQGIAGGSPGFVPGVTTTGSAQRIPLTHSPELTIPAPATSTAQLIMATLAKRGRFVPQHDNFMMTIPLRKLTMTPITVASHYGPFEA